MPAVSLPQFRTLDIPSFVERLDVMLQKNLQDIETLLLTKRTHTWNSLMRPLEDMDDELEQFWSPMSHMHAVMNSPELRDCYQQCLPKLSAYEAAMGHNLALYQAISDLDRSVLDKTQDKIVEDTLRGFQLSGVTLSADKKHRFEEIQARLSELSNHFENNVLDSSQAFNLKIEEEARLSGLPEHALHAARELALEKGFSGWILNLEIPCYLAVITYADDRALREEMYRAYVTRASEQAPSDTTYDNTQVMEEMLALRHEKARMLGFANFAEMSIAVKMAESTNQVIDFLNDLSKRAHHQATKEFAKLQAFAKQEHDLATLEPWDMAYFSEKKQQARYKISQEELRAYFPLPRVMEGLFNILNRLYGMQLERLDGVDTWHPEVVCYQISDKDKNVRGYIYIDLFARQNKRGGAWMDSQQSRRRLADGSIQLPIATLTCNFAKPAADKPPTLSHDEVITLFHEFGHCLHHVLTQVDYLDASGIQGVEWDAVELPSQFFENWCWEEEALQLLTAHVDTGEALPKALFQQVLAAKNFQSAMVMMRQLEFSLFDFRIHKDFTQTPGFIANVLAEVRKQTTVVPIAAFNRFQHSFSHIFGGGYAAGYYSYKWAEVLSSDAFSRFEEEGVFNPKTGLAFLHEVLEVGGSRKASESFAAFRGRTATIDALLRHNGIK